MRVAISRGGKFDENPTFALAIDPLATDSNDGAGGTGRTEFVVTEANDKIHVTTEAMTFEIVKQPFALNAYRADGAIEADVALQLQQLADDVVSQFFQHKL